MADHTLSALKQAVTDAGLEIYRVDDESIRIAERVRMHLMESGVVVTCDGAPQVALTVRAQRSDFPSLDEGAIFERVREAFGAAMRERGFHETNASTRDIHNPADDAQLLDVWFEITFARTHGGAGPLVEDVRWALSVHKCITP